MVEDESLSDFCCILEKLSNSSCRRLKSGAMNRIRRRRHQTASGRGRRWEAGREEAGLWMRLKRQAGALEGWGGRSGAVYRLGLHRCTPMM